jgi:hypothetical protein
VDGSSLRFAPVIFSLLLLGFIDFGDFEATRSLLFDEGLESLHIEKASIIHQVLQLQGPISRFRAPVSR